MTQILIYQCNRGIALATDSKAVTFIPDEQKDGLIVQKIFTLSPNVMLVTAGAGYGILLCKQFQSTVKSSGIVKFDEIVAVAETFLPGQINKVYQEKLYQSERPELERVYFVFAGYDPERRVDPFLFKILGSEHFGDPLHFVKTGHAVAIPRKMGIEYNLTRLAKTPNELAEALNLCEKYLVKLCRETFDVGPPLYFVRITEEGVKIRVQESVD